MRVRQGVGEPNNFYPRPPRGGRRRSLLSAARAKHFYPRPPRGGRHPEVYARRVRDRISIHALREEGDPAASTPSCAPSAFLSTPSARRATSSVVRSSSVVRFLSTPSARRATVYARHSESHPRISIHALREEGDVVPRGTRARVADFYPRPPRGGRRPAAA